MLNTYIHQSDLPNVQTQEQLLRDRLGKEKSKGYRFEFLPILQKQKVKFTNRFDLEYKDYSLEEVNDICLALIDGLVDGTIREADNCNATSATLSYGLESLLTPFGGEVTNSQGYILYVPLHKSFDFLRQEEYTRHPFLLGTINVSFDK